MRVGWLLGSFDGLEDGCSDGFEDGCLEGCELGKNEGCDDGLELGREVDGHIVGLIEDGNNVGKVLGLEGMYEVEGSNVGRRVGESVGEILRASEIVMHIARTNDQTTAFNSVNLIRYFGS